MQIKLLGIMLLGLCLALPGCDSGTDNGPKAAVVDLGRLMRESAPGKDGMKFIEDRQKEMQAQLDVIQDRLEKNPQDEAAMRELQKVYAESQQRIQAEGQNVAAQILDVVQRELNNYRAQKGYAVILLTDSLASFDPKLDVTGAVLAEIDKQKVEFKPLSPEQAAISQETAPAESAPKAPAQAKPAGK